MPPNSHRAQVVFTLPLACPICLARVRAPALCPSGHAFCTPCLDEWVKRAPSCPLCKVPISPTSPCLQIKGNADADFHRDVKRNSPSSDAPGDSDSDDEADNDEDNDKNTGASHDLLLRRTRIDIVLNEYEEEIKALRNEVSRLKKILRSHRTTLRSNVPAQTPLDASTLISTFEKREAGTPPYKRLRAQGTPPAPSASPTMSTSSATLLKIRLNPTLSSLSPAKSCSPASGGPRCASPQSAHHPMPKEQHGTRTVPTREVAAQTDMSGDTMLGPSRALLDVEALQEELLRLRSANTKITAAKTALEREVATLWQERAASVPRKLFNALDRENAVLKRKLEESMRRSGTEECNEKG